MPSVSNLSAMDERSRRIEARLRRPALTAAVLVIPVVVMQRRSRLEDTEKRIQSRAGASPA